MSVEWITQREAAEILGVHKSAIPKMQRRGDLTPRARRRPALSFAEVVALKAARDAAAAERSRARSTPRIPAGPKPPEPPDSEHEWLLAADAAAIVGCSVSALKERARVGTAESTVYKRRRWFRRDQLRTDA